MDLQLESGEYFLKPEQRKLKADAERRHQVRLPIFSRKALVEIGAQQANASAAKQAERAKTFVPPVEPGDEPANKRKKKKVRVVERELEA